MCLVDKECAAEFCFVVLHGVVPEGEFYVVAGVDAVEFYCSAAVCFVVGEVCVLDCSGDVFAFHVIVAFDADEAAKKAEGFAEMKKNVALHVAAVSAVPYLSRESVPASVVSEEMEILKAQMANDPKFANKPAAAIEKIVQGKLGKFYETNCLLEQEYVKAENKENVAQYIANASKEFGGSISIRSFIRYEKGEGLQKREEDFAAEIEKMVKG